MADNNLNLTAVFHGQDKNMSSTVMKLKAHVKSLEDQMKKFGDKAKNAIVDIPMEKYVKQINQGQKALNGLTKKHYDWAKANGVAGKQAAAGWVNLTNQIIKTAKEHERLSKLGGKQHAKRLGQLDEELKTHYKNAVAYKYLYNKVGDQRNELERRLALKRGELQAAELRAHERSHMRHLNRLSRMHRDAMHSMQSMSRIGSRALPYAAVGAGASGYAGVSAFKTRMRVDTAETNLEMFGQVARSEISKMRKEWLNSMGIKYGQKPDEMISSFTEVRKAGVPEASAKTVTDIIMKSAAGLDVDIKNATRFATRLATLTGDMSNLDPEKIKSMLNAVAIAGIESAADANEIIAANRRASGVFSSSKMKPEDLNAFTGTGISIDLPSSKVGTFMGFMVQELVNSKFETGKRAEDLSKGARELGFGSRANISAQMAANPADTMLKIFERMGKMPEQKRAMVADLIGMREWRDELGAFIVARDDVRRLLEQIRDQKNANRLDEISDKKLKSLAGRWKSFVSAFTLLWESVGAGLEKAFGQISEFFTDYLGKFDTKKISDTVEAITDGFVQGIGYNSWTEMLQAAFGDPANVRSWAKEVGAFVRGFVREMTRLVSILGDIGKGILKAFGGTDAESLGQATAHVIELVVALKALGTVATVLQDIVTFVKGIAAVAMLGPTVWSAVAGLISGAVGGWWLGKDKGMPDLGRKSGESKADHQKRIDDWSKEQLLKKSSYSGPTEFSSRNRSTQLADKIDNLGGKIERVAFMNSGGGISKAFYTGGGGGGVIRTGGSSGGGGFIGGVPSLLKNVPGTALPGSILGNNGSIIGRGKSVFSDETMAAKDRAWFARKGGGVITPGTIAGAKTSQSLINGATPGGGPDGVGAGLSGNSFLAARRAKFAEELKNDPNLRLHLAAMQQTEGASRGGTIESLMNRADMQGKTMRQMLGFSADGVRSTDSRGRQNSFYGPIRRGEIYGAIRRMQNNPAEFAKYDALTNRALAGSSVIGGHTDQGLPTDPNGSARTGIPGLRLRGPNGKLDGNEFTDWVGPGSKWGRGRQGAINYRKFIEQGISGSGTAPITSSVPTPAETIQNVPPATPAGGGLGQGMMRGGFGPTQIHINGSSHDPEALATLVQRRIDESMNWRTHDGDSEYT